MEGSEGQICPFIQEMLKQITIKNGSQIFKEKNVDMEALVQMTAEEIKELFPDDIKARVNIRNYLKLQIFVVDSHHTAQDLANGQEYVQTEHLFEGVNSEVQSQPPTVGLMEIEKRRASVPSESLLDSISAEVEISSIQDVEIIQQKAHGAARTETKPGNFFLYHATLESFMKSNTIVNSIVEEYKVSMKLEGWQRSRIVDFVVDGLMARHASVTADLLEDVSKEISKVFSNEDPLIYFQRKKLGASTPTGKLYWRYNNEKAKMRTPKKIKKEAQKPNTERSSPDEAIIKTWLHYNRKPWDEVVKRWKLSFNLRREEVNQTTLVKDFIDNWPILKTENGFTLVSIKFVTHSLQQMLT